MLNAFAQFCLLCPFTTYPSLCTEHTVFFLGFLGSAAHRIAIYNMQRPILHRQIPHPNSTFHSLFFVAALPDAYTAIAHTKARRWHSAGLRVNKVAPHHSVSNPHR